MHGHRFWAGGSKVATFCFATSTEAADLVEILLMQDEAGTRESKVAPPQTSVEFENC